MVRYEIKQIGVDKDFIQYTSPSIILGQISGGDYLMQWAVDMAINYICSHSDVDMVNSYIHNIYIVPEKILISSKKAWMEYRDNTANIGTELHDLVERFIKLKLDDMDTNSLLKEIEKRKTNIINMFDCFLLWQKDNVKRFIESELTIVEKNLCYAGTLDFGYVGYDDKKYCVDLKTSKDISLKHEMQVVAYKHARETMEGEYVIKSKYGSLYDKNLLVKKLKYDHCSILNISRDFFNIKYKIIKDEHYKQKSFEEILSYYYTSAKRQIKNIRAKERR